MGLVAPWRVGSSRARAPTCVPCIGRRILNHCTTREVPKFPFLLSQCELRFCPILCHLHWKSSNKNHGHFVKCWVCPGEQNNTEHQESTNKNHNGIPQRKHLNGYKQLTKPVLKLNWATGTLTPCWWEYKWSQLLWKTVWQHLKAEHTSAPRFSNSTQHKHVHVSPKDMHTAALFTIARTWKGPGTEYWVNALWLVHRTEGYMATRWMITSYTPHGRTSYGHRLQWQVPTLSCRVLWQVGGPWPWRCGRNDRREHRGSGGCSCSASSSGRWFYDFVRNYPTVYLWCVPFSVSIYFNKKLKYKRQHPWAHEAYDLVEKTNIKQVNTRMPPLYHCHPAWRMLCSFLHLEAL